MSTSASNTASLSSTIQSINVVSTSSTISSTATAEGLRTSELAAVLKKINAMLLALTTEYKEIENILRTDFIADLTKCHKKLECDCEQINNSLIAFAYKKSCAAECDQIIQLIDATIARIETDVKKCNTMVATINLLNDINDNYGAIKNLVTLTQSASHNQLPWEKERLRLEQYIIHNHKDVRPAFDATLDGICAYCSQHRYRITVYGRIIAAPPRKKSLDDERVKAFLERLSKDLKSAKINVVPYDETQPNRNNNYLVIGTEFLLLCHKNRDTKVCSKLHRVNEIIEKCPATVIPILLSGTPETAFPANYRGGYTNIRDWSEESYQTNFKRLLQQFIPDIPDTEYQSLWDKFEQAYPSLSKPFSQGAVEEILSKEKIVQAFTRSSDDRRNVELYNECKGSGIPFVSGSYSRRSNSFSGALVVSNSMTAMLENGKSNVPTVVTATNATANSSTPVTSNNSKNESKQQQQPWSISLCQIS